MSVISIQDATFSYDGKAEIFSHLTCDIETDQIFCILGPNGIGKSTLLKGIMNLHPLLNGRVQLEKISAATTRRSWRKKSLTFPKPTSWYSLTRSWI